MKCLEGIRDRVASVTVCDLAKQVLPSILDAEAAQMVQKHCEAQDVTFLLGDSARGSSRARPSCRAAKRSSSTSW